MTAPTEPCEHLLSIDSAEAPDDRGRRTVHLVCPTCGYSVDVLTTKTDAELAAAEAATRVVEAAAEVQQ